VAHARNLFHLSVVAHWIATPVDDAIVNHMKDASIAAGEEDLADVSLLQTSHGVFRAEVAASGEVPVLSEADLNEFDSMNLLQTSTGVSVQEPLPVAVPADVQAKHRGGNVSLHGSTAERDRHSPSFPLKVSGRMQRNIAKPKKMAASFAQKRKHKATGQSVGMSENAQLKPTVEGASMSFPKIAASFVTGPLPHIHQPKTRVQHLMQLLGMEHSPLACVFVSIILVSTLIVVILLLPSMKSCRRWVRSLYISWEKRAVRDLAEVLPVTPGSEVVNQLVVSGAYDCNIMRPLSSKQLLRLEARVEESVSGICLWTPLTQQPCVQFSTAVCHPEDGSNLPVQIASHSSAVDFVVSLVDAAHVRIEVEGRDVSTFDMATGRCSVRRAYGSVAQHWQEFTTGHLHNGNTQLTKYCSEQSVLDFEESALVLGTTITVIGELQRNAVGTLVLQPWTDDLFEKACKDPYKMSWRSDRCEETRSSRSSRQQTSTYRSSCIRRYRMSPRSHA
jgi:hypothetical protein